MNSRASRHEDRRSRSPGRSSATDGEPGEGVGGGSGVAPVGGSSTGRASWSSARRRPRSHEGGEIDDAARLDPRPFRMRAGQHNSPSARPWRQRGEDLRLFAAHHSGAPRASRALRPGRQRRGRSASWGPVIAARSPPRRRGRRVRRLDPALARADHPLRRSQVGKRRLQAPICASRNAHGRRSQRSRRPRLRSASSALPSARRGARETRSSPVDADRAGEEQDALLER